VADPFDKLLAHTTDEPPPVRALRPDVPEELAAVLGRMLAKDPLIAGDAFWALQAHRRGHGWMPIPANTTDRAAAGRVETGQWWALYYTGLRTLVNTAAEMAARAQVIRTHNYAMAGLRVPPHAVPPRPTITSVAGGRLYWQGSAGAKNYSIQWAPRARGPWKSPCVRCGAVQPRRQTGPGVEARAVGIARGVFRYTRHAFPRGPPRGTPRFQRNVENRARGVRKGARFVTASAGLPGKRVQDCGVRSQLHQVLLHPAQLGGKIEVVRTVLLIGADLHRH